ncbi:unnamed protein product [Owenia fusiformis]|uniref:Uncharacterized protein n=1 Tax=Owenia fusiformis TaxID=6347 RepID=A0A8J1Y121_OWEFU|nr:unnamed protein product [Owenia fusiformis]
MGLVHGKGRKKSHGRMSGNLKQMDDPNKYHDIIKNILIDELAVPYPVTQLILDYAQIWKSQTAESKEELEYGGDNLNLKYLIIEYPSDLKILKCVDVTVESHDQGWASGPGSWTWGEIAIFRDTVNADLEHTETELSNRVDVYRNKRACNDFQRHEKRIYAPLSTQTNVLSHFKEDTHIGLWLRSRFPGWANYTRYAKIRVWYT